MLTTIISGVITIVVITILLVAVLLAVKIWLTPAGKVKISINDGKKEIEVTPGSSLLSTLAEQKIFLSSACGGKGSCGQCKCQVLEGGGTILPTEVGFFNRNTMYLPSSRNSSSNFLKANTFTSGQEVTSRLMYLPAQ